MKFHTDYAGKRIQRTTVPTRLAFRPAERSAESKEVFIALALSVQQYRAIEGETTTANASQWSSKVEQCKPPPLGKSESQRDIGFDCFLNCLQKYFCKPQRSEMTNLGATYTCKPLHPSVERCLRFVGCDRRIAVASITVSSEVS